MVAFEMLSYSRMLLPIAPSRIQFKRLKLIRDELEEKESTRYMAVTITFHSFITFNNDLHWKNGTIEKIQENTANVSTED